MGGVEIHEKGNDFSKEVLKFMKKGSDCSREVLQFVKVSIQKSRVYHNSHNSNQNVRFLVETSLKYCVSRRSFFKKSQTALYNSSVFTGLVMGQRERGA